MCRRLLEGERVENLAHEFEFAAQTLYHWKRQALIDTGIQRGAMSLQPYKLRRAR